MTMNKDREQAAAQYAAIVKLLADLDAAEDSDAAHQHMQRIADHPLHVLVRSDWTLPGDSMEAAEFQILLCTGGPAVRIVGELEHGTPCSARLEYQIWNMEWIQYFGPFSAVLCDYASNFYFGD